MYDRQAVKAVSLIHSIDLVPRYILPRISQVVLFSSFAKTKPANLSIGISIALTELCSVNTKITLIYIHVW